MKGLSERVLSEDGGRVCVSAADTEGKTNLADTPERSKVYPPRSRSPPSCFEQLRQLALHPRRAVGRPETT